MINKQNLWFLTLFSLLMVLSIYYLTMSDDTLSTLNVNSDVSDATDVVISEENDTLVALRVSEEEALIARMNELEEILLSDVATLEEKNDAYEELQSLNKSESEKEAIIKLIKEEYKLHLLDVPQTMKAIKRCGFIKPRVFYKNILWYNPDDSRFPSKFAKVLIRAKYKHKFLVKFWFSSS